MFERIDLQFATSLIIYQISSQKIFPSSLIKYKVHSHILQ